MQPRGGLSICTPLSSRATSQLRFVFTAVMPHAFPITYFSPSCAGGVWCSTTSIVGHRASAYFCGNSAAPKLPKESVRLSRHRKIRRGNPLSGRLATWRGRHAFVRYRPPALDVPMSRSRGGVVDGALQSEPKGQISAGVAAGFELKLRQDAGWSGSQLGPGSLVHFAAVEYKEVVEMLPRTWIERFDEAHGPLLRTNRRHLQCRSCSSHQVP